MIKTPLCDLLGIEYPIFQGGMAWISDGKLAAAVSNGGGLGIISAMNADAGHLKQEIDVARSLTKKPFGVFLTCSTLSLAWALVSQPWSATWPPISA